MIPIASATTFSVAANAVSADQVATSKKFVGKGVLSLFLKSSATGLNCSMSINGYAIVDDQPISWFGTTGSLSVKDNLLTSQAVNGGAVQLTFRNTTGGALTVDYMLGFDPLK